MALRKWFSEENGITGKARFCAWQIGLLLLMALTGCQVLNSSDVVATIDINVTSHDMAIAALQQAAAADATSAVATVAAAGTKVAENSFLNVALGATLRANYTATPAVRAVVVSAEDMGDSLESDMMDDMGETRSNVQTIGISNLDTARAVQANSGCSAGSVRQFRSGDERIYATARVSGLQVGTYFEVDWIYQNRVVNRVSWLADYAAQSECIWFYVTAEDFAFLPGAYSATLFVNGASQSTTEFTISTQ